MECPIVSGIVYANGDVDWINVDLLTLAGGVAHIRLSAGRPTSVGQLADEGELNWTGIETICEAVDSERHIKVVAGEGSMGADGFVALYRPSDNQLIWIAFFENSNPFVDVELGEADVLAKTSLANAWRFPLASPSSVSVD